MASASGTARSERSAAADAGVYVTLSRAVAFPFNILAGRGHQGIRRAGDPGGVNDNVLILCIAPEAVPGRIEATQQDLLGARPAIVMLSDCMVLRVDHF